MIGIEHPDHTGSSSNPRAPWNQGDPVPLICDTCWDEPEYGEGFNEGDCCIHKCALPDRCNGTYMNKENHHV